MIDTIGPLTMRRGGGTGRRTGLKILGPERGVRVQSPPPAFRLNHLWQYLIFHRLPISDLANIFANAKTLSKEVSGGAARARTRTAAGPVVGYFASTWN